MSRVATAGRTRLGAYAVCVDERGRVLLCRTAPGYPVEGVWTLPGGGVDFGEHPDVALLRELAEETGLAGGIEEVVMVWSRLIPPEETASGEPLHVVGIIYRVSIVGRGEPRTEVGGSTDACGWFALDEVAGMPVAAYAREAMARALPAPDG